MPDIAFTIPGIPVAQPRQRHRVVSAGNRVFATNYTPRKDPVNSFKAAAMYAAQQAYDGPPLDGPVKVSVVFAMPRPARLVWKKRPMPREMHVGKPDIENLVKSLLDAMTGILWRDDAQVCSLNAFKVIAAGEESPHVALVVQEYCY